jgi:hypothetical protein
VLDVLELLTRDPLKYDHITTAGIYHAIDDERPTLLLDEVDNLELGTQAQLRALLNSGHKRGGKKRIAGREFLTFAPVAFGAIGALPGPLMQRSIVIHMERASRQVGLRRLDQESPERLADLRTVHCHLSAWARQAKLDRNPPMPSGLHNRRADNWRVLLAIADACDRGALAREAALALSREHQDEDAVVELLADIRKIFDLLGVNRLPGKRLVAELCELEEAMWSAWRGARSDQQAHRLSQAELAVLLRRFRIFPKSVWPVGPRVGAKSGKGYHRDQFLQAWRAYCSDDGDGTPAQDSNIRLVTGG